MLRRLPRWLPVAIVLLCGAPDAADGQLPGHVLRVIDGDSLMLDVNGGHYRIELAGIDAPEVSQPWGGTAAQRLHRTLTGAFVVVDVEAGDSGHQVTGSVEFRGRDVALDLLYDGLAWSTIAVSDADTDYAHPYTEAENQARAARRGLWSDERPIPPWEWRRGTARQ